MSLKIGQVLSSQITENTLSKFENVTISNITTRDDVIGRNFQDIVFSPVPFESGNYYYLKLVVKRISSRQDITIKLDNSGATEDYTQYIDDFTVFGIDSTEEDHFEWAYYETIIAPGTNYNQIRLILTRTEADFEEKTTIIENNEEKEYNGRIIELDKQKSGIYQIKNLIEKDGSSVNKIFKTSTLTKFGIQGPSGMLMCINGEGIRIGPSGIYEIKDGYSINFLSILPGTSYQNDGSGYSSDTFIIDYQYNDNNLGTNNNTEGE